MFDQRNWMWCERCQQLWFAGNATRGGCPAGGAHSSSGSGNYQLSDRTGSDVQSAWTWCHACASLFFNRNAGAGVCPTDPSGHHRSEGSGNYSLSITDTDDARHQGGWRWCHRCAALFFSRNPTAGTCPAGGAHDASRSGTYRLQVSEFPTEESTALRWSDFFRTAVETVRGACIRSELRSMFVRLGEGPPFEYVVDECVEWAVEQRTVRVRMEHGDIIDISIVPNVHPREFVQFELRTDPAITWWKGVQISRWHLTTQDSRHGDACFVPANELGRYDFAKAGFLGRWFRCYRVDEVIAGGSHVTIAWRRD